VRVEGKFPFFSKRLFRKGVNFINFPNLAAGYGALVEWVFGGLMDGKTLSKAGIAGVVLAVVGIILFLVLWFGLGQIGIQQFPRLILALCVPPALMAALVGVYMLVARK
jgi:hypothetical protein